MSKTRVWLVCVVVIVGVACSDAPSSDAGSEDASMRDAGSSTDAGGCGACESSTVHCVCETFEVEAPVCRDGTCQSDPCATVCP